MHNLRRRRRSGGVSAYSATINPASGAGAGGGDTYLESAQPDRTDRGAGTTIVSGAAFVDTAYIPILKVDVSSIPSGSVVTAATLSLWEESASIYTATWDIHLHRILKNWVMGQVCYNSYSTGNAWGTAGIGLDGVDAVAAASATVTFDQAAAAAYVGWSGTGMTADVQAWVDGTANYGWAVVSDANLHAVQTRFNVFSSADHATAGQRPKLTVAYTYTP